MLKPVGFSYILYEDGDLLGKFLAYLCLLHLFYLGGIASLMLVRRELRDFWFFLGLILNETISLGVKTLLKIPRPDGCDREDHGMPSSHSQFHFFFAFFVVACLNESHLFKWLHATMLFTVAVSVAFARWYLGYHTIAQVLVGAVLGIVLAQLWARFVHSATGRRASAWLASMRVYKMFSIQNTCMKDKA